MCVCVCVYVYVCSIVKERPYCDRCRIKCLVDLCASVSELHGMGLAHFDIKPDNTFVHRGKARVSGGVHTTHT